MIRESSIHSETLPGASYWLIERDHTVKGGKESLTIILYGARRALPIFSFLEEARLFLSFGGFEKDGWRVSESTSGGLLQSLVDNTPPAEYVALDPLPEMMDLMVDGTLSLVILGRQRFIHLLIRESASVSQSR